ncbi:MAG: hypothetical protein ABIR83_12330 [Nakamurella sp.]
MCRELAAIVSSTLERFDKNGDETLCFTQLRNRGANFVDNKSR